MGDVRTSLSAKAEAGPARKVTGMELLVFCFLIVPSLATSFLIRSSQQGSFPLVATMVILRDTALVALIAYFLWRNGEPKSRLGWSEPHPAREALLGAALYVPFFFVVSLVAEGFVRIGLTEPKRAASFLMPKGPAEVVLAVVLVVIVAFSEETIFRGYLMLRLRQATRSGAAAVLIAAAIFSIGHGYEGTAGVATVGVMGVLLGLVYMWRGSLVAPIVMHFLQDFIAIVAAPSLPQH